MDDLGAPTSYLACAPGTVVIDATGARVGSVAHVLAVVELDVFDGIVIAAREPSAGHRFADADQIAAIYEQGVVLKVAWDVLPVPAENPAALETGPDDLAGDGRLAARLHRAWEALRGRGGATPGRRSACGRP